MHRQPSPRVARRNEGLLQRIRELKAEPPDGGYRRIWASRHCIEPLAVDKKRMLRLRRVPHLLVTPHQRLQAKRTPTRSTPTPTRLNAWWGIDRTKVLVQGAGWVATVVGLDWYPKAMGGDSAGIQGKVQDRPSALDMAVHRQFLRGARGHGLARRRDHGGQPPSRVGMRAGAMLASHQALTRDHNPTGNADTARVMRTLNEAGFWRKAWTCPAARIQALEGGMASDNERYRHSALGDKTPRRVEREHETSHGTPFAAA